MIGAPRLDAEQQAWLAERLGDAELIDDLSWGLVASHVLHVRAAGRDLIVKAGDETNHHIARELSAHPVHVAPLVESGHAARLVDASAERRIMVLEFLPGEPVQGGAAEHSPDVHRQAGELLRRLHGTGSRLDPDYQVTTIRRALAWLDGDHRVEASVERAARAALATARADAVPVVPTHGDWQPRNWLIDDGVVRVIDFGRFGFRPASSDLTRLAAKQWRGRPELERAFFDGYGPDPRTGELWRLDRLKEAVGTACWAYRIGDEEFEMQGHRMLRDVLAEF